MAMIYLDNAATTRVYDSAIAAAAAVMANDYYNPNATYKSAVAANESIEQARNILACTLGVQSDEIIFTSCATESNNWVFNCGIKNRKGNIVITAGEHSSVYECAMQLKSRGTDVRIAPLTKRGDVNIEELLRLVDQNTSLVSVIHVNNETGVVNPIKTIARAIHEKNDKALIHCDGVQGALKLGESISGLGVDYYSASAHKLGAPKGIGLLYIRRGLNIAPLLHGGGQERGMRSGTQNTPYIAAFAAAVREFNEHANRGKMLELRNSLCNYFTAHDCKIVGEGENSGYILCVCLPDIKAEILQNIAHDNGVIIGKGAACSGSKRGNRVLSAMGLSSKEIEGCIRLSFFTDTTSESAHNAAKIIVDAATQLRSNHVK